MPYRLAARSSRPVTSTSRGTSRPSRRSSTTFARTVRTVTIIQTEGTTLEAIYINFSDPRTEVDGQRSEKNTPHPILSDLAVRQALNLAIQRDKIASEFYGDGELATPNQFTGLDFFESPNTAWEFNLDKAAATLDEAGWTLDGDVRKKDGVELSITYATSVNQVRQKTQAVVKQDLESIGFKIQLEQVDSTIFFDCHFRQRPEPQPLLLGHRDVVVRRRLADPGRRGPPTGTPARMAWASPSPRTAGRSRTSSATSAPEYDALYEQLLATTSLEEASELIIGLNDTLINDVATVPIAIRSFYTAINNRLRTGEHRFRGHLRRVLLEHRQLEPCRRRVANRAPSRTTEHRAARNGAARCRSAHATEIRQVTFFSRWDLPQPNDASRK